MYVLLRRLVFGLAFALVVVAVGTIAYRFAGLSWMDALYQTVVTITTVGYTDLAPDHKGITILLIGFGTLVVAVLFSLVTGVVIEAQIRDVFGRRRMEREVSKLHNHFIVCGFGRFGRTIATELGRKNLPFAVIEQDEHRAENARELGHLAVQADATEEETLTRAGIERSRGLLTTLGSDAANVYVTLTAKQMNRALKVVAIALDEGAEHKLRAAGADDVISPFRIGGHYMAQCMTAPIAADFLNIATGANPLDFFMDEQRIEAPSPLAGKRLRDTPIRRELGVIVVAVRQQDGAMVTNPAPDLELHEGDVLVSLGQQAGLSALHDMARG